MKRAKRALPFAVLFEDESVLVVDKPAGLLTTHTRVAGRLARESQPTVENILNDYVRKGQAKSKKRVWLVHRLDRETSGVMLFAKTEEVSRRFRAAWSELTDKTYVARVEGALAEGSGVFESFLCEDADGYKVRSVAPGSRGARLARTEWRRLSSGAGGTLVEVKLKTGRKNQIRVHFSEAGHPVVGDVKYGARRAARLCLHAWRLGFVHPRTGKWLWFTSDLPAWARAPQGAPMMN